MNTKIIYILIAVTTLWSCQHKFDEDVEDITSTAGTADFTKYVALGNSLTSGYRDGTLYIDGQNESYPSMLAAQFATVGGGTFTQPMMPDNIGGFSNIPGFSGKLQLMLVNGSLAPVPTTPVKPLTPTTSKPNNMGVPGAKSFHLSLDGYGNMANLATGTANPFFVRFASSTTTSVIKDAVAQAPTFFSLWIGNNDVLTYATTGGVGMAGTGTNDYTPAATFNAAYTGLVNALVNSTNKPKGVLANIPYVTSIPFFTTVPAMPFTAGRLTSAQISQLNAGYAAYNGGLAQAKAGGLITADEYNKRLIKFVDGQTNGAVFTDNEGLTNLSALGLPSYRMTTSSDLILLTTSSALSTGGGTSTPLTDAQVLSAAEIALITTATDAYNATIKNLATANGLAFVDANAAMQKLSQSSGLSFNGVKYTATFVTGGAFSLDGVHPNGRGYAIIANEFIKAINATYGSNLAQVNPNNYSGVTFPN